MRHPARTPSAPFLAAHIFTAYEAQAIVCPVDEKLLGLAAAGIYHAQDEVFAHLLGRLGRVYSASSVLESHSIGAELMITIYNKQGALNGR